MDDDKDSFSSDRENFDLMKSMIQETIKKETGKMMESFSDFKLTERSDLESN